MESLGMRVEGFSSEIGLKAEHGKCTNLENLEVQSFY